jgi:hypothetical protein
MNNTALAAAFLSAIDDLGEAPAGSVRTTLHTASSAAEDWLPQTSTHGWATATSAPEPYATTTPATA